MRGPLRIISPCDSSSLSVRLAESLEIQSKLTVPSIHLGDFFLVSKIQDMGNVLENTLESIGKVLPNPFPAPPEANLESGQCTLRVVNSPLDAFTIHR